MVLKARVGTWRRRVLCPPGWNWGFGESCKCLWHSLWPSSPVVGRTYFFMAIEAGPSSLAGCNLEAVAAPAGCLPFSACGSLHNLAVCVFSAYRRTSLQFSLTSVDTGELGEGTTWNSVSCSNLGLSLFCLCLRGRAPSILLTQPTAEQCAYLDLDGHTWGWFYI